jgi:hypothetical protein
MGACWWRGVRNVSVFIELGDQENKIIYDLEVFKLKRRASSNLENLQPELLLSLVVHLGLLILWFCSWVFGCFLLL